MSGTTDASISLMSRSAVERELRKLGVDADNVLRQRLKEELNSRRNGGNAFRKRTHSKSPAASKKVPPTDEHGPFLVANMPLPERRRQHLASMIKPARKKRQSGPQQKPPKKTRSAASDVYPVEKLLDVRTEEQDGLKARQFLVRWEGFGPSDDEWVDEFNLSKSFRLYTQHPELQAKLRSFLEPY